MVIISDNKSDFTYTRIQQHSFSEMRNAHYHPYAEMYFLLSGTRKFFIDNTILTLSPGDLIMIPKGIVHRTTYISDDIPERITMSFSDRLIKNVVEDITIDQYQALFDGYLIQIPEGYRGYLTELMVKMDSENKSTDTLSEKMLTTYIEEMFIFLLRCKAHTSPETMITNTDDHLISSAAKYISENYYKELTLEGISKMFSISPTYFSKKFKTQTGFGFKEYLMMVRCMEASKLLKNTDLTITEISEKCGFESSNYFGDAFKKSLGSSPRDYRKSNLL